MNAKDEVIECSIAFSGDGRTIYHSEFTNSMEWEEMAGTDVRIIPEGTPIREVLRIGDSLGFTWNQVIEELGLEGQGYDL